MSLPNKINKLFNIPGVEEIDDFQAEFYQGGFRFAVSANGSSTARSVTTTTAGSTREPAQFNDDFVRIGETPETLDEALTSRRYLLVLHDANNGDIVRVIRGEENPAFPGELINVGEHLDVIADGGQGNRSLEYRAREIFAREGVSTCSNICNIPSSDKRIKTNAVFLGIHEELGVELYSWQYINDDQTRYVGVMAQDLLARPDLAHAVVIAQEGEFAGYYAVNYNALGLRMATEAEWQEQGISAVENRPLAVCVYNSKVIEL